MLVLRTVIQTANCTSAQQSSGVSVNVYKMAKPFPEETHRQKYAEMSLFVEVLFFGPWQSEMRAR